MWHYLKELLGLNPFAPVIPPCTAGDFVCKLTDHAHYLKDYIPDLLEPVVLPVADVIGEYPIISALVTGTLLAYYFKPVQHFPDDHAVSSGYRNNCGLHSIIHSWLALPEDEIKILADYPGFRDIFNKLYEYYDLGEEVNLDHILQLNQFFSHPHDREILWGQVFRRVLQDILTSNSKNNDAIASSDDKFLADDILAQLTERMGANLRVYTLSEVKDAPAMVDYPCNQNQWEAILLHNVDHFDFTYQDPEKNKQHNKNRDQLRSRLNGAACRKDAQTHIKPLVQEAMRKVRNQRATLR